MQSLHRPKLAASRTRILLSYVFDYVILAVLLGVWSYISSLPPNHSRFSLIDISLQYPIANPETISYSLAIVLSVVVPVAVVFVWALGIDWARYRRTSLRERLWEFNVGILGLALSVTLAIVVTTTLKCIVGRPRPDAIARCMPADGSKDAAPYGLSSIAICTQPDKAVLDEGFRSWPSGHSSTAFSGLFYLSLYVAGKLSLMDNKGEVWKTVLVLFPTLGAGAIATSRILDHRHHGTDVLTGSILGVASAWLAYRQYYPSLADTARQGRAWSMRVWGESKPAPLDNGSAVHEQVDLEALRGAKPDASDMPFREEYEPGPVNEPRASQASIRNPSLYDPLPPGNSSHVSLINPSRVALQDDLDLGERYASRS